MAEIKKFNNGHGVLELHDIDYNKIVQESFKKDLIDLV